MRLEERFSELKAQGESALIVYITAGDPSLEQLPELLHLLQEAGADMVEVGFPFSDPLADGPVIQSAMFRALKRGTTLPKVLETIARCRSAIRIPLIAFTYTNPVQRYGFERFAQEARSAGFDACLMTDMPPDEAEEWLLYARAQGLQPIFLLTPTSTTERIRLVAQRGEGFIYCVSRTGVTGARDQLPPDLPDLVARIREHTTLPIAVGFGVSNTEQVRQIAQIADGVVVGSRIVQMIHDQVEAGGNFEPIAETVRQFKRATKR